MNDRGEQRRNLLIAGAIGGVVVLGGASAFSLATTLAPDADVVAKAGVAVDLTKVPTDKFVTVTSGNPYWSFVARRLGARELEANDAVDLDGLIDHHARNLNLPESALATSTNRRINQGIPFVIYSSVCTVRGCQLKTDEWNERHEWYCPCCGARYDFWGRTTSYAPRNLPVPRFVNEYGGVIRLLPLRFGRDPAFG